MNKKYDKSCSYFACRKAIWTIFWGLKFVNCKTKAIVRDSYLINLNQMIQYARSNNINELDYIWGIRDILINSGMARERQ